MEANHQGLRGMRTHEPCPVVGGDEVVATTVVFGEQLAAEEVFAPEHHRHPALVGPAPHAKRKLPQFAGPAVKCANFDHGEA